MVKLEQQLQNQMNDIKKDVKELKNTLNNISDMLKAVYEFENVDKDLDNIIFKKGKYKGKTYKDVRINNIEYFLYLIMQPAGSFMNIMNL